MSQRVRLQRKDGGYLPRHASHTHGFSQRTWHQRMMLGGMIIVVITAIVLRYAVLSPQATAEAASQPVHLTAAPPFGTATPAATARISHKTATALVGATPYSAPIVAGYPDPRLDTPAEQQLRANAGNPQKIILVSITGQFMQAFQNSKLVHWSYVTTGQPGLDTPLGTFHIFQKQSPVTFIPLSTDPRSPDYGFLSKVQYGMEFQQVGYYIHDVWWRTVFGPGYNDDHYDPGRAEWSPGSHGCVNTPLTMMSWLYLWADMGTTVVVFE